MKKNIIFLLKPLDKLNIMSYNSNNKGGKTKKPCIGVQDFKRRLNCIGVQLNKNICIIASQLLHNIIAHL